MAISVNDVVVTNGSGEQQRLGDLNGQVVLAVNVASRCGFTRQYACLLYTSPSPRDRQKSRMPSSA